MEKGDYRAIHRKSSISHTALRVAIILQRCIISPRQAPTMVAIGSLVGNEKRENQAYCKLLFFG
jgi:hypothetical protein